MFFVDRALYELKNYFLTLRKIMYNLLSTNLSVHEHVQHIQTMKFHAHEIKWFHSPSDLR